VAAAVVDRRRLALSSALADAAVVAGRTTRQSSKRLPLADRSLSLSEQREQRARRELLAQTVASAATAARPRLGRTCTPTVAVAARLATTRRRLAQAAAAAVRARLERLAALRLRPAAALEQLQSRLWAALARKARTPQQAVDTLNGAAAVVAVTRTS
jgi:hypothetical protein